MANEQAHQRPQALGLIAVLGGLYRLLSGSRRRHLHLCLWLMILGAAAELFTIGAVLPFLALISSHDGLASVPAAQALFDRLGWRSGPEAIVPAAMILCGAAAAAAGARLLLTWASQSFVFGFGHELGVGIYRGLLRQPYAWHVRQNSSQGIAAVEKVQQSVIAVLLPVMQGLVALVLTLFIAVMLVLIEPGIALVSAAVITLLYGGVSLLTQGHLRAASQALNEAHTARIKQVQEGLGGIRDILLDRSQAVFEQRFAELDQRLRHSQLVTSYIATVPRVVIESGAIILVAAIALHMSRQPGGVPAAIPMLGAFALGAQRLLPQIQIIYLAVTRTRGAAHTIEELTRLAATPPPSDAAADLAVPGPPLNLCDALEVRSLRFQHPDAPRPALERIDLRIEAGERLGLTGATGSGKSTLLDLLMGLLDPCGGQILIDGQPLDDRIRARWQAQIALVPQFVYLADSSFAANIAFGVAAAERDMARIRAAAAEAQIADFIESLPGGYEAAVGERGVRLSGGQRQRVGIARALYKPAGILILDEATSALDDATEAAVMAALAADPSPRTMLIVAHRMTTLRCCDRVVRLAGGRIVEESRSAQLTGGAAEPHELRSGG